MCDSSPHFFLPRPKRRPLSPGFFLAASHYNPTIALAAWLLTWTGPVFSGARVNNCDGLTVTGPLLGVRRALSKRRLLGGDSEESPVPSSLLTLFLWCFGGCCGAPRGGFRELRPKCWATVSDLFQALLCIYLL